MYLGEQAALGEDAYLGEYLQGVSVSSSSGWRRLLEIQNEARLEDPVTRPQSCPNDGEPLRADIDGYLVCPFDGWRPGGAVPQRGRSRGRDWGGLAKVLDEAREFAQQAPHPDVPGWGPIG